MVNTTHPGNIGAAARAMKNMGLSRLYLVDPKIYPSEEALWRAGHALDVLDNATVVDTVDEAIGEASWVVGTSARERKIPWPLINPRQLAEQAQVEGQHHDIAILFGREDRGLTNEELQKCHVHLTIPTSDDYPALNIAQAIQVVCYELRMAYLSTEAPPSEKSEWDVKPASVQSLSHFFDHLEATLIQIEFLDPKVPRQTMTRLKRLFTRLRMDEMEVSMLRGVLKKIDKS